MRDARKYIIGGFILIVALTFLVRLFYLQVVNTNLKKKALRKTVKNIVQYPPRGVIFDRSGEKVIIGNKFIYDVNVTVRDARRHPFKDTLKFCHMLGISKGYFDTIIAIKTDDSLTKEYSPILPMPFLEISEEHYAQIMGRFSYPGFSFSTRAVRHYHYQTLGNAFGYVAKVDRRDVLRDASGYYADRDSIGRTGIERAYEGAMRGKKGVRKVIKNARGLIKKSYLEGAHDTNSVAGFSLISTIDIDLQLYGEKLMKGKTGSVVAIEPATGEIIAMVSAPNYDPNRLSITSDFSKNYVELKRDSANVLFDRATMPRYPAGSTMKPVFGLIGLQEKVITPQSTIFTGFCNVGDHGGVGHYNIRRAIQVSSNCFFVQLFKRTIQRQVKSKWWDDAQHGLTIWRKHLQSFGLGHKLGSDIPQENGGYIPDTAFYNRIYHRRWNGETVRSLAIGQGEIGVTPLQMANFTATIANHGHYITPHLVKAIISPEGVVDELEYKKNKTTVDSSYFKYAIDGMEDVLKPGGTAWRVSLDSIVICGKTGTAENPHGKDHSLFVAFAPRENPKIAIAVIVENGGYGSTWAAPIASLMIEQYLTHEIKRDYLEERMLSYGQ